MLNPRILRLNVAGQPVEWLSWQEATCLYARDMVAWTLGEHVRTVFAACPASAAGNRRSRCTASSPAPATCRAGRAWCRR